MEKTIVTVLAALAGAGSLLMTAGTADARAGSVRPARPATLVCPSGTTCGSYAVTGLGTRKQQLIAAGASVLDLSVAMEETADMLTSYYPYVRGPYADNPHRDNPYAQNPYGDNKTGDSANFGVFKQNWGMLRTGCSAFRGQTAAQYNDGAALNSNLRQDVSCLTQDQNYYGLTNWFAGQRAGASGLRSPNSADINSYKNAVYWIEAQLNANRVYLSNDTRFWVYVPSLIVVARSIVGDTARNGATVENAVPVGPLTVHPDGSATAPVRITFSDGTRVSGLATMLPNGENKYTVSRR